MLCIGTTFPFSDTAETSFIVHCKHPGRLYVSHTGKKPNTEQKTFFNTLFKKGDKKVDPQGTLEVKHLKGFQKPNGDVLIRQRKKYKVDRCQKGF